MALNETIVTICGNLAATPEHKRLSDGSDVVNFRIASTPRQYSDGQYVDGPTSWYQVSAWGSIGLNCVASLRKGQRVIVQGRLRIRQWSKVDDDGNEQLGRSADIKAYAVGHDLAWGTSEFKRVVRAEKIEHPGQEEADALADEMAARQEDLPRVDADGVILEEGEPARV